MTQRPKFWLVPGARAVTVYTQPANSFEKPSLDPVAHSATAVASSPDIPNHTRTAGTHGGGPTRARRTTGTPTLLVCLLVASLVGSLVASACRRADPPAAPASTPARPAPIVEGRPVYKHSVIPGGVRDASELTRATASDVVVARHYREVNVPAVRRAVLTEDRHLFVSYRRGDRVDWTRNKVRIPAGEAVLTDGTNEIRERCGNRMSMEPLLPISEEEPEAVEFDALLDNPVGAPPEPNARATPPGSSPDDPPDDEIEGSDPSDPEPETAPEDGLPGRPLLNARSSTGIPSSGGSGGSSFPSAGSTTSPGDGNGNSTRPPGSGNFSTPSKSGSVESPPGNDGDTPPRVAPNPPGGSNPGDPSGPGNAPGQDPPEYFYDDGDDSSPELRYGDPPIARVPEPGTWMLVGTGLGLGARYLLRRRTHR